MNVAAVKFAMSFPCSDCYSNLLCSEASSIILSGAGEDYLPECTISDPESPPSDVEESIAGLLEDERDLARICFRLNHQSIDASVRAESVAWILKVQHYYCFQPLTAYLSVNYFDRFLLSQYHFTKMNEWTVQLLSVACLSLAAKMEEPLVPSLLDLQVEGAKFNFEPRSIQRMELLVLRVLDWRLRPISPFCYLRFFAFKIDPIGTYTEFLTTRAKFYFLSSIKETSFIEYRPSCVAVAIILCASNDVPKLSYITAQHAESWCDGLQKEEIMSCRELIEQIMFSIRSNYKQPKVLPQFRVMSRPSNITLHNSSILLSSSSSSLPSSSYKRRKLNDNTWADDHEKGSL